MPMQTNNLETRFHAAMQATCVVAENHGYIPVVFLRMLKQHGAVRAAKILLRPSDKAHAGLRRLAGLGLLCISVEAHAVRPLWAPLFTEAERAEARRRLDMHGHSPRG